MSEFIRRRLIQLLSAATCGLLVRPAGAILNGHSRLPVIGAVRWDAWYDPEGKLGQAVEASLGPNQFHSRMPFFGQELDGDHVRIDGYHQDIFDREITYARGIGLNYWAYCWYNDGSPLRRAWELHQKSAHANEMNWCMLWQFSKLGGPDKFSRVVPEFVKWFAQANYQKIDGAPLVYLYIDSDTALTNEWSGDVSVLSSALDKLRSACRAERLRTPHIVILNRDPTRAATMMKQLNASAISNYIGWVPNEQAAPFSKLLEFNRLFWDKMATTGAPVVPIVMTGWDTRPRKLHPPPWEKKAAEQLRATRNTFVTPGTNDEIDNAIRAATTYVERHPIQCPSNLVLIYSWDECDEGGGALVSKSYLATEHHLR
jgi:hypothetical protein